MRLIDGDALEKFLSDAEKEATKRKKYVFASALNVIQGNVRNFPTIDPEPHWIPTSKECPPQHHEIWITDVYGDVEVVYRGDGKLWLSNDGDNGYVEDEILAWMPASVPSPYQPEEESE